MNQESKYLLVQGVPAVGASQELLKLMAVHGVIMEYRILDDYPAEHFTEVYLIKFERIQAARYYTVVSLTLNAPIATKVVCFSRMLKCLKSLYGKQRGPRSVLGPRCFLLYLIGQ